MNRYSDLINENKDNFKGEAMNTNTMISGYELSYHATKRLQQRGIRTSNLKTLLEFGRVHFHRGREVIFFDHKSSNACEKAGIKGSVIDYCRGLYAVIDGQQVVTVAHRYKHLKRDRKQLAFAA